MRPALRTLARTLLATTALAVAACGVTRADPATGPAANASADAGWNGKAEAPRSTARTPASISPCRIERWTLRCTISNSPGAAVPKIIARLPAVLPPTRKRVSSAPKQSAAKLWASAIGPDG